KKYILFLLIMFPALVSAQNVLWKDYFSYREITDIFASDQQIFVATRNAVFVLNNEEELVAKYNTTDNSKLRDIRYIYYGPEHHQITVRSQNGNLALIDTQNGRRSQLNDIANKATLTDAEKIIYDLDIHGNTIYVATGF